MDANNKHLPRVIRQLFKTVLTIVGLIFLAQLSKVYFHSEVFSGVFNATAGMTFLISPFLIFAKRMPPEKEKEFLKNHPIEDSNEVILNPATGMVMLGGGIDAGGNAWGTSNDD